MIRDLVEAIKKYSGKPIKLMEVCGTHTMSIARIGLKNVLPENIKIVSGPGCPVCVTHQDYIEKALLLSKRAKICTFGDLMRVPGKIGALAEAEDVEMVYSPIDCIEIARANPHKEVVFLSIGFETTTPSVALAVLEARKGTGIHNLSFLTANKTMPNVLETLLTAQDLEIDGLIYPGHVATIVGAKVFDDISKAHKMPGVIAGFEPIEVLSGICELLGIIEAKTFEAKNCYKKLVTNEGNLQAQSIVESVFESIDAYWRGFGMIAGSGLGLKQNFSDLDAEKKFAVELKDMKAFAQPKGCRCGEVLKGKIAPRECGLYGKTCTPQSPIGACMVSSEGACAAEFRYGGLFV